MQNQPGSDLVLADCVRFWPNGSGPEASRCARIILLLANASHLILAGPGMSTGISFSNAALESSSVGHLHFPQTLSLTFNCVTFGRTKNKQDHRPTSCYCHVYHFGHCCISLSLFFFFYLWDSLCLSVCLSVSVSLSLPGNTLIHKETTKAESGVTCPLPETRWQQGDE